jgi:hypothetical protein
MVLYCHEWTVNEDRDRWSSLLEVCRPLCKTSPPAKTVVMISSFEPRLGRVSLPREGKVLHHVSNSERTRQLCQDLVKMAKPQHSKEM